MLTAVFLHHLRIQMCIRDSLIGQQITPDFHTSKTVLRVRVRCQNLQIGFKAIDKAFALFNLLREVFEQMVLQTILLALVVGFHQLQAGYLHICLLYTSRCV